MIPHRRRARLHTVRTFSASKGDKMKVHKAMVIIADTTHTIVQMDVIEHAGQFWLVPEWLDNPTQRVSMPLRIVSLATMSHQRTEGAAQEFVVNDPVPKLVFDGQIPPEQSDKFVVVELPDIRIPLAPRYH
jgi:hypothetical protein